jgi:GT2 family glycosyltransferase
VKVLIVTYRRADLLRRCVSQLGAYFELSDLLVVDNMSSESERIADFCAGNGIRMLRNDTNEGFAKAVNQGMRQLLANGPPDPWVLLINPDTELLSDPNTLPRFANSDSACITTFDGAAALPWDCEKPIPNPWRAAWEDSGLGRLRIPQPLGSRYRAFSERHKGYLVGCFLIVSTAAWESIGGFDERFWLYSEEVDWCLRVYQAKMTCQVVPMVGYRHEARQASSGSSDAAQRSTDAYWQSRMLFIEKHWGSRGFRTYRLVLASLTAMRSRAGRARRIWSVQR